MSRITESEGAAQTAAQIRTQLQKLLFVERTLANEILPQLLDSVHDGSLKQGLTLHATQTHNHVERLHRAFELLGQEPGESPDEALAGLEREHEQSVALARSPKIADFAHARAVAATEHLEIASYTSLLALVRGLRLSGEAGDLLEETLTEEKDALGRAEQALQTLGEGAAAVAARPA